MLGRILASSFGSGLGPRQSRMYRSYRDMFGLGFGPEGLGRSARAILSLSALVCGRLRVESPVQGVPVCSWGGGGVRRGGYCCDIAQVLNRCDA